MSPQLELMSGLATRSKPYPGTSRGYSSMRRHWHVNGPTCQRIAGLGPFFDHPHLALTHRTPQLVMSTGATQWVDRIYPTGSSKHMFQTLVTGRRALQNSHSATCRCGVIMRQCRAGPHMANSRGNQTIVLIDHSEPLTQERSNSNDTVFKLWG